MDEKLKEIYFSVDIEADGPIPSVYSMLSLGCGAFFEGKLVDSFSVNLHRLEGAIEDIETMEWWETQPQAWEACHKDRVDPSEGIGNFVTWVRSTSTKYNGKPVCVCYPAGFDFTFLYFYIRKFKYVSPFSFSALDIKSYASALLNLPYRETTKKAFPKEWFEGASSHTHVAVGDAVEQGLIFMNMMKWQKNLKHIKEGV